MFCANNPNISQKQCTIQRKKGNYHTLFLQKTAKLSCTENICTKNVPFPLHINVKNLWSVNIFLLPRTFSKNMSFIYVHLILCENAKIWFCKNLKKIVFQPSMEVLSQLDLATKRDANKLKQVQNKNYDTSVSFLFYIPLEQGWAIQKRSCRCWPLGPARTYGPSPRTYRSGTEPGSSSLSWQNLDEKRRECKVVFLWGLSIFFTPRPTKYLHTKSTGLCLASSKILTPTPFSTQRMCPPPLAGRWGGWEVNILEDASHRIGLLQ